MSVVVKVNVRAGCQIEASVDTPKQLVKILSEFGEVLTEMTCKDCNSAEIKYDHRVHDGNDFYGMKCLRCGAKMEFGQHKTGNTLFAKRDKGKSGWYHYQKGDQQ